MSDGRLPKYKIINELTRRIEWLERAYGFRMDDVDGCANQRRQVEWGRYRALIEMRYQIQNGLFIGGAVC